MSKNSTPQGPVASTSTSKSRAEQSRAEQSRAEMKPSMGAPHAADMDERNEGLIHPLHSILQMRLYTRRVPRD
ncbi:uncharacterized protein TrAtP1_005688 [Trichoderma atroviride]|uniref:uncharacterized protein n=1 Tax=Hypocrea atroviridis TaxID=63577 RepID=UPI003333543E|nr:hypothetical protein TrAtP1_005688 [Trichoderma atroviride]